MRLSKHYRVMEAVHYDRVTREPHRFHERYKVLESYSGRDDVFGSFRNIPKLGINFKSGFGPIGIYCFPIDLILKSFSQKTGYFMIPYSTDPYLLIFQVLNIDKALHIRRGDSKSINVWNSMLKNTNRNFQHPAQSTMYLRKLGYIGVVDHGTGTIMDFKGERTQAVFFDPASLVTLDLIDNEPDKPLSK